MTSSRSQTSFTLVIGFTILTVAFLAIVAMMQLDRYRQSTERLSGLERVAGEVLRLDEVLTSSALLAASTGEEKWIVRYRANAEKLNDVLSELSRLSDERTLAALQAVSAANDRLVARENQALSLSRSGPSREAYRILSAQSYAADKKFYGTEVANAIANEAAVVRKTRSEARNVLMLSGLLALLAMFGAGEFWRRVLNAGKQRDQELEPSKYMLEQTGDILNSLPAPVALFDADMCYVTVNSRWREDFWTNGQDYIGLKLYDIFPNAPPAYREAHDKVFSGGMANLTEQWGTGLDGQDRWISWVMSPWKNAAGVIVGMHCMAFNISDQVNERKRLEHGQLMLREMQAMSLIGAAEIEIATGNAVFSEETYHIFGLDTATEASPWRMAQMLPEAERQEFIGAFKQAAQHGVAFDLEREFTLDDGTKRWVRCKTRRAGQGHAGRLVVAVQDVSDRKAVEETLNAAITRAEAANESKSAFLANTSHEIRTPLNGVIGIAGALARTEMTPSQAEMVSLIKVSGETLERLLNDILDMSKIEAGHLTIETASFDLKDAIEDAARLMRVRADDKGVEFGVRYGNEARGLFEGDVVRVKQIVANLASNAIKFTEAGAVTIFVDTVEDAKPGEPTCLTIKVVDTGIGFDSEAARRLFQRFEQADGTITRQFGGTGLGLSICRSLTDMMGGSIEATSTPGEGSTFTVTLPLDRTMPLVDFDRRVEGAAAEVSLLETADNDGPAMRVLLAEDHPVNQKVVRLILEPYGVDITVADNGKEAFDLYQTASFDVVLMDMQMPVMDGLDATTAIRAYEAENGLRRTPIAMLTANAMADHKDAAALAGADHHISKPITPESLLGGIDMAIALGGAADGFDAIDDLFDAVG